MFIGVIADVGAERAAGIHITIANIEGTHSIHPVHIVGVVG